MLLILTRREDLTADFVITRLEERGLSYFRLNSDDVADASVSVHLGGQESTRVFAFGGCSVRLEDVTAVWYRRAVRPLASPELSPDTRPFATAELRHIIEGILPDDNVRWVNPMEATERAERKLNQLRLAQEVGLQIPPTVVSNDLGDLRDFVSRHGRVICKPISQGLVAKGAKWFAVHTREIDGHELEEASEVSRCPTLLQQLIPKGIDVRVTLIGDDAFIVDIETPPGGPIDWRAEADAVRYSVSTIPEVVLTAARKLMIRLRLVYGALDFVRTDDGSWYFLEVNPAGEWAWLEVQLGLPMRDSLIALLYNG